MLTSIIPRSQIIAMLPHGESMCLIDGVVKYDEQEIICFSHSHRDPHNPLRSHNQLSIVSGIEYAAQAIAIHSRLNNKNTFAQKGFLAKVKTVKFLAPRLDDLTAKLIITAQKIVSNSASLLYDAALYSNDKPLLTGTLLISKVD